MTCYIRHLKSLMVEAGLPDTKEGRKELDRAVRASVGLDAGAPCPEVWAEVKKRMALGPQWAKGIVGQLGTRC